MAENPGTLDVRVGFTSEKGRRERNEDFVGTYTGTAGERVSHGIVAAVADGMGGAKGGREAAETTVRGFIDGYYGQSEILGVERAASQVLESLNRWVHAQGRANPALEGMATTFSALVIFGRMAHVIHVGDSRVYRWSDNRLDCLTEDHTHNHPDLSHVLYRAIGIEESLRLDHATHGLEAGERFLLCSDGVHNTLSDERIAEILSKPATPDHSAQQIVDAALQSGSRDNTSAVVVDVVDLPSPDRTVLEHSLSALAVSELPLVGETVDGFELTEIIFSGRNTRLYKAEDTQGDRTVVLKFPHPRIATDAAVHQAFVREAWMAARIRSPWVGTVIELAPERRTRLYSAMPFYDGETLEQRLVRLDGLSLKEGIETGIKLAKAVAALHRVGIVHRDIKPENVMLLAGGDVKLLDLGVARLRKLEDSVPDDVPGTASFMAPEMFAGEAGDEMTDLYALGVTLYRAFTGAYPYGEIEPFSHPRFRSPAPPSQHRPDMPAWLDATLTRAVAVNPDERFGDVLELSFELENGVARAGKQVLPKQPLYHRDPVRFWQFISLILLVSLLIALMHNAA